MDHKTVALAGLKFMQRVELKGAEVEAWQSVNNMLQTIASGKGELFVKADIEVVREHTDA